MNQALNDEDCIATQDWAIQEIDIAFEKTN